MLTQDVIWCFQERDRSIKPVKFEGDINMIPVQRPSIGKEELEAVGKVFATGWLGLGSTVKEFEDKLKEFLGAKHAIAVNTGTSALHIALESLEIGSGDKVIVPSLIFVASIQAITACGAEPVFCDVREDTLNLDPDELERRIVPEVRAIMPVHYGGLACDMDPILSFAQSRGLTVVEDAAHAFGSSYCGKKIGTLSDVTCFSFDPIKNITCGEGGAVVTDRDDLAGIIVKKRILGIDKDTWSRYRNEQSWFYEVQTHGFRYHMSNINAAIGLVQFGKLDRFIHRKREIIWRYDESFKGISELILVGRNLEETAPFFYVIRVREGRDELMSFLKERGIGSGVHYIPNHLHPVFTRFKVNLPVTEKLYREIVTLPLYYDMTDEQVEEVIKGVKEFFV